MTDARGKSTSKSHSQTLIYIDDLIIGSNDETEHLRDLEERWKAHFGLEEIKYLGFLVNTITQQQLRTKSYEVTDKVYARNYGIGPTWVPSTIVEKVGNSCYRVENHKGIHLRHLDQLKRNHIEVASKDIDCTPPQSQPELLYAIRNDESSEHETTPEKENTLVTKTPSMGEESEKDDSPPIPEFDYRPYLHELMQAKYSPRYNPALRNEENLNAQGEECLINQTSQSEENQPLTHIQPAQEEHPTSSTRSSRRSFEPRVLPQRHARKTTPEKYKDYYKSLTATRPPKPISKRSNKPQFRL
ncbi:hypothetical protein DdX_22403 [Ditylenchus destructor]|uniref:Reverse transcriptase domain-containing protein n=1 Tax=Ditylenchus destructor TaxID=166010 RepID=A0AAD4QUT7_9BILA|nr:hypothetical protein DdX_22403 [Ditylenchus destructor]